MIKLKFVWFFLVVSIPLSAFAQDEASQPDAEEQPRKSPSIGIEPGMQQPSDMVLGDLEPVTTTNTSSDDWEFEFHGYLRAPMRLGIGTIEKGTKEGETVIHSPPLIPDGDYTLWQYSGTLLGGPWAELKFSYGNSRARANVHIASYNITDGGFRLMQAQLGIDQAFVTLDFPTAFGSGGGLKWTVGVFQNSYGAAGRYDAGKYDTYIIGRTHTSGETLSAFYDLSDDFTLQLEHGVGAKLDVPPIAKNDDPPYYIEYPGPPDPSSPAPDHTPEQRQQGTTLIHHAHLGFLYRDMLQVTAHYLTTWTDDAVENQRDGRISVFGGDIRLTGEEYGDGYLGFSHLEAKDIRRIANSLETIHATLGGWNLRNNYFETINNQENFQYQNEGTGTIDTIGWQYTFSLAKVLWSPKKFWGQGPDLLATIFGMYNMVSSDEEISTSNDPKDRIPTDKLKFGAELTYVMIKWLAASCRYDSIQPDMDDSTRSFHVLSPKLIIRTDFVTHEQVIVQYSHYFLGDETVIAGWRLPRYEDDPLSGTSSDRANRFVNLDEDVFQVAVTMWW